MAESNKVRKKTISPGLGVSDTKSVDTTMLEMLKRLDSPKSELGFGDALSAYSEGKLKSLKEARKFLEKNDGTSLEEAALQLSNQALRVGAVNMLKSSFELQSVARYKDFEEAETIVQSLELEYLRVRQDLEGVT